MLNIKLNLVIHVNAQKDEQRKRLMSEKNQCKLCLSEKEQKNPVVKCWEIVPKWLRDFAVTVVTTDLINYWKFGDSKIVTALGLLWEAFLKWLAS